MANNSNKATTTLNESVGREGLFFNCMPFCYMSRMPEEALEDATIPHDEIQGTFKKTYSIKTLSRDQPSVAGLMDAYQTAKSQTTPHTAPTLPRVEAALVEPGRIRQTYEECPTLQVGSRSSTSGDEMLDVCFVCDDVDCKRSGCQAIQQPSFAGTSVVLPPGMPTLNGKGLRRIREFYKSLETDVMTTTGLVNLYLATVVDRPLYKGAEEEMEEEEEEELHPWRHAYTGVLICLLDSGYGRRDRRLQLILADPNTAFPLWREEVTHHSGYTATRCLAEQEEIADESTPASSYPFHYLRVAGDNFVYAGFCFDLESDSEEILAQVTIRSQYCQDASLNERSSNRCLFKRRSFDIFGGFRPGPKKILKKDISKPVFFAHLTSVKGHY